MRRLSATLLFAFVTVTPLAARAAEDAASIENAKTLFNAGAQAYAAAQFPAAIQAFEEAYKLSPKPQILFSLAQAEKKQYYVSQNPESLRGAAKHYKQYVDAAQNGGRSADALNSLAELGPRLAELEAKQPITPGVTPPPPPELKTRIMVTTQTQGVTLSIDGRPGTSSPSAEVTPGKHRLKVSAEGYYDEERQTEAIGGTVVALDIPLREKPATLEVETLSGAEISVDGRLVATTPSARPIEIAAGSHFVAVTKNGYKAFTRDVSLERGKRAVVAAPLEKSGQRAVSYVLLGAGVVGVVAGGVFTGVALAEQGRAQRILDDKARGNIDAPSLDSYGSAVSSRDRWRTASLVTFGASAAVLATGAILYFFDKPTVGASSGALDTTAPRPSPPKRTEPIELGGAAPIVSPGFVGLAVFGRL